MEIAAPPSDTSGPVRDVVRWGGRAFVQCDTRTWWTADAVGMSTVPEVIAAVHAGLDTVALSLITDACDPDDLKPIDIPEIMRVAEEAEPKIAQLVRALAAEM